MSSFKLNIPETSCDCVGCRTMCLSSPCLATPLDVIKLINAGYGKSLARVDVLDHNTESLVSVIMIKGEEWQFGEDKGTRCILHTDEGLCKLHDTGLKPTEGRIMHHGLGLLTSRNIRHAVLQTWDSKLGRIIMNPTNAKPSDFDDPDVMESMRVMM